MPQKSRPHTGIITSNNNNKNAAPYQPCQLHTNSRLRVRSSSYNIVESPIAIGSSHVRHYPS
ncbi:hypothetical protein HBI65_098030 [Parastagonospora nodorum]|nr:hypothetical protein HBH68_027360 [Parastagonospora nodorum]KAH6096452.1 hypothetical protein HBI65_098030 [Parastagonospora nodorum]KAH6207463.1 hypothetical protein HBI15_161710 [Parastagonospora nodorum]